MIPYMSDAWSFNNMAQSIERPYSQDAPSLNSKTKREDSELKSACRQFEAFFLQDLLKTMRESIPKTRLLDGGRGEDVYRSLLDHEWAKKMASAGGIGLARILYERLMFDRTNGEE